MSSEKEVLSDILEFFNYTVQRSAQELPRPALLRRQLREKLVLIKMECDKRSISLPPACFSSLSQADCDKVRRRMTPRTAKQTYAHKLRSERTAAEDLLWGRLKDCKLRDAKGRRRRGYKFLFQHVRSGYIVDFYCGEKKLFIEVDGGYHFTPEQQQKDKEREENLLRFGGSMLRFKNEEIEGDIEKVIQTIQAKLDSIPSDPTKWIRRAQRRAAIAKRDHSQKF
jgi:very-short-patch-repair endonuclease